MPFLFDERRARYGTPLLYKPRRDLVDAVEEQLGRLARSEPSMPHRGVALLRLAVLMRSHRGHLRDLIRRYRAVAADPSHKALPSLRYEIADYLLVYRAARLDLLTAMQGPHLAGVAE